MKVPGREGSYRLTPSDNMCMEDYLRVVHSKCLVHVSRLAAAFYTGGCLGSVFKSSPI